MRGDDESKLSLILDSGSCNTETRLKPESTSYSPRRRQVMAWTETSSRGSKARFSAPGRFEERYRIGTCAVYGIVR